MVDVITYARSGYPQKNNSGAVGGGGYVAGFVFGVNEEVPVSGLNTSNPDRLADRLDDVRYYTGDTP